MSQNTKIYNYIYILVYFSYTCIYIFIDISNTKCAICEKVAPTCMQFLKTIQRLNHIIFFRRSTHCRTNIIYFAIDKFHDTLLNFTTDKSLNS